MSQQGLQRTQQLLQVIGQQLPSIAQASETPGIDLACFINGALLRSGLQQQPGMPFTPDVQAVISALASLIGPPTPQATPRGQTVDDDPLVNS